MSKVTINFSLKNNENHYIKTNIKGILNNNELIFNDDGIITTVIIKNSVSITRKNKDYIISLDLCLKKDTTFTYKAYDIKDLCVSSNLKTIDLKITNNSLYSKYQIEEDVFELTIDYEVNNERINKKRN